MPKRVRMLAEILPDKCHGCRTCEKVCPTIAITVRNRRPDEIGPGRKVAVMALELCYNAQACFEVCPNGAIVMHELEAPFDVGMDMTTLDPEKRDAVNDLCARAGYPPNLEICVCTTTKAAEIAAAILDGAGTPEEVSRKTGARTGCKELCLQPIIEFLHAAGHTGMPRNPEGGFQWYGLSATLKDNMTPAMQKAMTLQPKFDFLKKLGLDRAKSAIARLVFSGKSPLASSLLSLLMPAMIKKEVTEEFKQYSPEKDMQNMIRYFGMVGIEKKPGKKEGAKDGQH